MKTLLTFVLCCSSFCLVIAQDIIVMRSGEEIKAKVEEVGETTIKYRKFDNMDGPLFNTSKSQVFMIKYQNGDKDVFPETQIAQTLPLPAKTFQINPLGLLQFGPIFQGEFRVGAGSTYIVPHLRIGYLGILSHYVWTEFEEDDRLAPLNLGIGAGVRRVNLSEGSNNAFYYGGVLEMSFVRCNYNMGWGYETVEEATNLAVIGNLGYRWRYPTSRFLSVGLLFGVGFSISDVETAVNPGYSYYAEYSGATPFGMLELSFGWEKK